MKHKILAGIGAILFCAGLSAFGSPSGPAATTSTYYVNPLTGNDENPGTQAEPFRSLKQFSVLQLNPGDSILLAAGTTVHGSLVLKNVQGEAGLPIVISSYAVPQSAETHAVIDARGFGAGIQLEDCNHIRVEKLVITANGRGLNDASAAGEEGMRCGVLVRTTKAGVFGNITLSRLVIRDIFYEEEGFRRGAKEVHSANGTQRYGWGIRFINETNGPILENLVVGDCEIRNVSHTGIKFTGQKQNIRNVVVRGNRVLETGGPGLQFSNVINGRVSDNYVSHSGSADDSRKWGRGSGLWTWGCADFVIERNQFLHANGPGDSAGCHIDFNCRDVVVQYNFSADNAGGFIEILGNNYNCAYRYNISVNDGFRVKGKNGAFQEGKILWTSGFVGKNNKKTGPFNSYIYNNTIYVKEDSRSCFSVSRTTEGILIANNIFHILGETVNVSGDQDTRSEDETRMVSNVVFTNNLYAHAAVIPESFLIKDSHPVFGDPKFKTPGGFTPEDYRPGNKRLIRNKGIYIEELPGDTVGLKIGLGVTTDFLGNPVKGKPDLGAIELQ